MLVAFLETAPGSCIAWHRGAPAHTDAPGPLAARCALVRGSRLYTEAAAGLAGAPGLLPTDPAPEPASDVEPDQEPAARGPNKIVGQWQYRCVQEDGVAWVVRALV